MKNWALAIFAHKELKQWAKKWKKVLLQARSENKTADGVYSDVYGALRNILAICEQIIMQREELDPPFHLGCLYMPVDLFKLFNDCGFLCKGLGSDFLRQF